MRRGRRRVDFSAAGGPIFHAAHRAPVMEPEMIKPQIGGEASVGGVPCRRLPSLPPGAVGWEWFPVWASADNSPAMDSQLYNPLSLLIGRCDCPSIDGLSWNSPAIPARGACGALHTNDPTPKRKWANVASVMSTGRRRRSFLPHICFNGLVTERCYGPKGKNSRN